jgi:hypothetical protein
MTTDIDRYLIRLRARLEAGAAEYGDLSFQKTTPTLLDEIQQELEDVSGWAFILWAKIDRLRRAAETVQPPACEDMD